jgi:hypothetical protein
MIGDCERRPPRLLSTLESSRNSSALILAEGPQLGVTPARTSPTRWARSVTSAPSAAIGFRDTGVNFDHTAERALYGTRLVDLSWCLVRTIPRDAGVVNLKFPVEN